MARVIVGTGGTGTGFVTAANVTTQSVTLDGVARFNSVIVNDTDGAILVDHTFDPTAAGANVVTPLTVPAKSYLIIDNGEAGAVSISNVRNTHGTGAQSGEAIYVMALF